METTGEGKLGDAETKGVKEIKQEDRSNIIKSKAIESLYKQKQLSRVEGQRQRDRETEQSTRDNNWTETKSREETEMEISLSPPQHKDSTWVTVKYSHSSLELGTHRLCYSSTKRITPGTLNNKIHLKSNYVTI